MHMYAKHLAIFCIQVSLVGGVWSLVNATTKTEYVCPDVGDTQVENSEWLDIARASVIILSVISVLVYQLKKTELQTNHSLNANVQRFAQIMAAVGAATFLLTMVLAGDVCGSGDCVTSSTVDKCKASNYNDSECKDLRIQAAGMTGQNEVGNVGSQDIISYFSTADHYCQSNINSYFGGDETNTPKGERCLAYSCNDLVSGRLSQKVTLLSALLLCTIGNALFGWIVLKLHPQAQPFQPPPASAPPLAQSATPAPAPPPDADGMSNTLSKLAIPNASSLRRRHQGYSAVRNDLAF